MGLDTSIHTTIATFASFNISFEYLWMDGQKKTSKVPAPQYIDFVMSWIQTLINDENTFPTKDGTENIRYRTTLFTAVMAFSTAGQLTFILPRHHY